MSNMLHYATEGFSEVGDLHPGEHPNQSSIDPLIAAIRRLKTGKISVDTTDGVQKPLEVVTLPAYGESFKLLRLLAVAMPTVYVYESGGCTQGMLSPHYDEEGEKLKPELKFQPLMKGNFLVRSGVMLPDPDATAYLSGACSLEAKGAGSHNRDPSIDPEHNVALYGAFGSNNIEAARRHSQHEARASGSSLAYELTSGSLGTLFQSGRIEGFNGFAKPRLIHNTSPEIAVMIPVSYLDQPDQSFGAVLDLGVNITPELVITSAARRIVTAYTDIAKLEAFTYAMRGGQ